MNINTNYNVMNRYSILRANEPQQNANNSVPAFKMADKITKTAIVTAPLVAASIGTFVNSSLESKTQEAENVTIDKVKEFLAGRTNFTNVRDVNDIVYNHPQIVKKILETKNPDGSQYFDEYEIIYEVLDKNADILLTKPEKVFAVLNNPQEMADLRSKEYNNFQGGMFHWAVKHPLDSTREANPGLFDLEEPITMDSVAKVMINMDADNEFKLEGLKALYAHPELVEKMASLKDAVGHQYIDAMGIAGFISNVAKRLENKEQIEKLDKFLNDPKELGYADNFMNRGFGLWRCFIDC